MTDQRPAPQPQPHPSEAATPEPRAQQPQTRRAQVSAYAQGSVANMLRSLLVIGAIMALMVVMFPRLQPVTPDIDVLETARQVQDSAGLTVSVPMDLPEGWVATRAQYARSTDSLMTWTAAYLTPDGEYVALQETLDATDGWVGAQVNNSPLVGQVDVAGQTWDQYNRDVRVQRSLASRGASGELTTVITGTASWDEIEVFAEALAPVAAGG